VLPDPAFTSAQAQLAFLRVDDSKWHLPGVQYHSYHHAHHDFTFNHGTYVTLSYWLIVLLTFILPTSRLHFRKRHRPGLCPKCRYDLRATPDRCPECGTVVKDAAKWKGSDTEDTEYTEREIGGIARGQGRWLD